ncbi:MAG: Hsp20/alpha crystallin family protein [Candidatus Bathyarchaeia archaeon]
MRFRWEKRRERWWHDLIRGCEEVLREFNEMLEELNRFQGMPHLKLRFSKQMEPLVEIYEKDDIIVVLAEVPGVEMEDIDLNVSEKGLEISAETPQRRYHRFVDLSTEISRDAVEAHLRNGVLEVKLKRRAKKRWNIISI